MSHYVSRWRTAANTISASETFASRGGIQDGNPQSTSSTRIPRPSNNNNTRQSQHAASPQPGFQPYNVNTQSHHGPYVSHQPVQQPSMPCSPPTAGYQQGYQSGLRQTLPPIQSPTWPNQVDHNPYGQPQYLDPPQSNAHYSVQQPQSQMFNNCPNQGYDGRRTPERRTTTDTVNTWDNSYANTGLYDRPVTPLQRVFSDPMTYTVTQAHSCPDYWN